MISKSGLKAVSHSAVLFLCLVLYPAVQSAAAESPPPGELPRGFGNVDLGMPMDEVKKNLEANPYFLYRGDPDVSLLPEPNRYLIECEGRSFISRAFFQFYDGKLYTMTLILNPELIDYFTMYTTLKAKHGNESSLSPRDAVWETRSVRMSLERPLSVKYIDVPVFEKLKEAGRAAGSAEALTREKFLKEF